MVNIRTKKSSYFVFLYEIFLKEYQVKFNWLKTDFRCHAITSWFSKKSELNIPIQLICFYKEISMNYFSMPSNRRSLKLELIDGSIQEIEYELPIDRYDLLRMIYHGLKYDHIYDWNTFYQSTAFTRTDNGITTVSPLNQTSNDTVYILVLPTNNNKSPLAKFKRWLWPT